jgi:hypothetical protein
MTPSQSPGRRSRSEVAELAPQRGMCDLKSLGASGGSAFRVCELPGFCVRLPSVRPSVEVGS